MRICDGCNKPEGEGVKFSAKHRKCNKCRNTQSRERLAAYGRKLRENMTDEDREYHRQRIRKHRERKPHAPFYTTSRYLAAKAEVFSDLTMEDAYDIYFTEDICSYCGKERGPEDGLRSFHIDHIIPMVQGGPNSRWNLVKVCASCNTSKGSASLYEFRSRTADFTEDKLSAVIDSMVERSGYSIEYIYELLTQSHEFEAAYQRERAKMITMLDRAV